MAIIRIIDLQLRTLIGINQWEKNKKQDVVINISMEFDAKKAAKTDNIKDTVDYKTIKNKIVDFVENSQFNLLETLTSRVLDLIMEDKKVISASVRIDKPAALRFAKSVSFEMNRKRT